MFLSDDTIHTAGGLGLYQYEGRENKRTCLHLCHLDPPVHSQSLSEDLLLVGEFVAERCIRGCHIKCECFPLSNLIMDFYGGISRHTERQSIRTVIGLFSFNIIYGICGLITESGNGLQTTEMLICRDWFNACSSGEFSLYWLETSSVVVFPLAYSQILLCGFHNLPATHHKCPKWGSI